MTLPERDADQVRCDWTAERIRKFGYRVVDAIAGHLTSLPGRPVFQPFPEDLAQRYLNAEPLSEAGETEDELLSEFLAQMEPYPFGNGHPRFYGWVNSPPDVIAVFAEALAAAMNPSCAGGNHAAIYVERQVLSWFKHLVGFPAGSMGLLLSGTSMAAVTAMAVARHVRCGFDVRSRGLQESPFRLLVYQSGEGHGCHQKAAELLGIGSDNLRTVAQTGGRQMDPKALDAALRTDIAHGHRPLCVVASAGTVNTGAIDPIAEIADVCAEHGVWLHVDGAYGAPAILSRKYRDQLSALSRADSLSLDPHKWLYVPVEAGLVLVRDASAMRATFSLVPPYLWTDGNPHGVGGLPWFSEYGMQQTRGFRALKVWMALRHHGLSGYREFIEHDIALAEHLAILLRAAGNFEVCEPRNLSIVCFRFTPSALVEDPQALDSLNRNILERIQVGGEVFLSSTVLDGKFWLRACIINHRATSQDVAHVVNAVSAAGASWP